MIPSVLGLPSSASVLSLAFIPPCQIAWSRGVVRSFQLEALHYLSDMPLICLNCDSVRVFNDTVECSPALLEVWVSPEYLFPDLILLGYHLDEELYGRPWSTDCNVVAVHGRHDILPLDAASPHIWARASPRQSETSERRGQFLFPILCGVTRAVQAVSQQSTHVFVTWLVVLGRQFDKYLSSCWSVEVRPPHVDRCQ